MKNTDYWIDLICEYRKEGLDRTLRVVGAALVTTLVALTNPQLNESVDARSRRQTGVTFAFKGVDEYVLHFL